jgi:predicted transcriptional regulator
MTKMVREAIEVLRELPEERQETIARAILDFASHDDGVYHLTDEERAEVRAGLDEIERGDIATEREVRAVYKRIGL